jgi:hypothetical protein
MVLPNRVRGLAMPHVELVDMKVVNRHRRGVHLLSERLEHLLRTTIEAKKQAILLLNRRGYSNFVYCVSCQNAIQCKYCDTTMTYHRAAGTHARGASSAEGVHTGHLHCHNCLAVNPLPEKCEECGKKLSLFGLGTPRDEEEIARFHLRAFLEMCALEIATDPRADLDGSHGGETARVFIPLGKFARNGLRDGDRSDGRWRGRGRLLAPGERQRQETGSERQANLP